MTGLRFLIAGAVWGLHEDKENALSCFRQCLSARNFNCSDGLSTESHDKHITVFALYELGVLLLDTANVRFFQALSDKSPVALFLIQFNFQTYEEGKEMLLKAQNDFKDYDNESAFSVKINHALQMGKRRFEEQDHESQHSQQSHHSH